MHSRCPQYKKKCVLDYLYAELEFYVLEHIRMLMLRYMNAENSN